MQLRLGNDQRAELGMNVAGDNARQAKSLTQGRHMDACGGSEGKQETDLIRHSETWIGEERHPDQ
jgi:hypothetical protein